MGGSGLKRNKTGCELESWVVGVWRFPVLVTLLFCAFLIVYNQKLHQHTHTEPAKDNQEPRVELPPGRWADEMF